MRKILNCDCSLKVAGDHFHDKSIMSNNKTTRLQTGTVTSLCLQLLDDSTVITKSTNTNPIIYQLNFCKKHQAKN